MRANISELKKHVTKNKKINFIMGLDPRLTSELRPKLSANFRFTAQASLVRREGPMVKFTV